MKMKVAVAAALALSVSPAVAQDWPMLDDWNFTQLEKGCEMWTSYDGDGETMFSVYQQADGVTVIAINNRNWSFEADKLYDVTFALGDDNVLSGVVPGLVADGYHGVITKVSADFPKQMRDLEFIKFGSDDPQVYDELDLSNSGRALDRLDQCVAAVARGD